MKACLAACILALGLFTASGQDVFDSLARRTLSDQSSVSLVTMWPGVEIYLAFGHSAIRVRDPVTGIDLMFNYGTFDFSDPLFVPRFVRGDLRYFLNISRFQEEADYDRKQQRRIWVEQVLDLDRDQRNRLWQFLVDNARPENRYYRYDFVLDNCSTRIRDALAKVLGKEVSFSNAPEPGPLESSRKMIDRYVTDRPMWRFGFYLALGRASDKPVGAWEAMFLPQKLLAAFDKATVLREGKALPLVRATAKIIDPADPSDASSPWTNPAFLLWPAAALALVLAVLRSRRKGRGPWRLGWRILDSAFFLLVGILGVVIGYLDYFSVHSATKANLGVAWLLPTQALAAFLLLRPVRWRWLPWYFLASAVAALLALIARPFGLQGFYPTLAPAIALVATRSWAVFDHLRNRGPTAR